ncbi:hypothetical protein EOD39_3963 [Acipenser ruthenus]|uniref:Uncharacterized protein n=1 Tax=Acipenser ruthenus TaxID=7906 RepID=A0A444UKF3_ACIRT|nr:hypothetical protein EOD39_3963 [Acipenser ruthenus]
MATENQQGASSVVARYYTRWYKTGSCIRGRLLEVNEDILMNPSLLQEKGLYSTTSHIRPPVDWGIGGYVKKSVLRTSIEAFTHPLIG